MIIPDPKEIHEIAAALATKPQIHIDVFENLIVPLLKMEQADNTHIIQAITMYGGGSGYESCEVVDNKGNVKYILPPIIPSMSIARIKESGITTDLITASEGHSLDLGVLSARLDVQEKVDELCLATLKNPENDEDRRNWNKIAEAYGFPVNDNMGKDKEEEAPKVTENNDDAYGDMLYD